MFGRVRMKTLQFNKIGNEGIDDTTLMKYRSISNLTGFQIALSKSYNEIESNCVVV